MNTNSSRAHRYSSNPINSYLFMSATTDIIDCLDENLSPEATYRRILSIHETHNGSNILYPPNRNIKIAFDASGDTSINLNNETDFNNCTFEITGSFNNPGTKQPFLFSVLGNSFGSIFIDKREIDSGDFSKTVDFPEGLCLLKIEDQSPFTIYHPATNLPSLKFRSDILLVDDKRAINRVIAPYDNSESIPIATYKQIGTSNPIVIKNVTIIRTASLTRKCHVLQIQRKNDIHLENIQVETLPPSSGSIFTGDSCISISDSTNVTLKDIEINGTYSQTNQFGYGLNFTNIWNLHLENIVATDSNWGVTCGYNLNHVTLKDCHLNRLDLHLYGRDFYCEGCTFENTNAAALSASRHNINRFGGLFGYVRYKACVFEGFTPLRIDWEFQLYTPFDLIFESCTIKLKSDMLYLIEPGNLNPSEDHFRQSLNKIYWPNISMEECQFVLPENTASNIEIPLFYLRNTPDLDLHIEGLYCLRFHNMKSNKQVKMIFCNYPVLTANTVYTRRTEKQGNTMTFFAEDLGFPNDFVIVQTSI